MARGRKSKEKRKAHLQYLSNDPSICSLSLLSSGHDCTQHQHSDIDNDLDGQQQQQQPFLAIVFQKKPLDKKADQAIKVVMRHLEIIYNPTTIQGVISFFKAPNANSESFDALIEVAGDTLEGFKRQTRAGLEYALENHTTLDLDVDMDAPIIIIPEK
jgi:vacuolar protein sorting-associated protein 13A/C